MITTAKSVVTGDNHVGFTSPSIQMIPDHGKSF